MQRDRAGLRGLILTEYESLHARLFPSGISQAQVVLVNDEGLSGYRPQEDRIEIHMGNGDIRHQWHPMYDPRVPRQWPPWKQELVHEMIHEYENKVELPRPEQAESFVVGVRSKFGVGHDWPFAAAIIATASYFGLTAEEFAALL